MRKRDFPDMAKVLVVDDDTTMRALLRVPLEADGHDVHEAALADEGLDLARKLKPDIILLDFVLPDADGLVLLRELRRWGVGSAVLALTGSSSPEVATRFLRAGAADFLQKEGLTASDVRHAVRRAMMVRSIDVKFVHRRPHPGEHEEQEFADGPQNLLDDPPVEADAPSRALRILVVDDTKAARAAVKAVLERETWTIDEARDLADALDRIKDKPDVVLLDYLLPDVDGIEALDRLRAAGLDAPVIALSGHGSEDVAVRFMRAGAIDFLPKDDLSEARLVHAIRRAVALQPVARRESV